MPRRGARPERGTGRERAATAPPTRPAPATAAASPGGRRGAGRPSRREATAQRRAGAFFLPLGNSGGRARESHPPRAFALPPMSLRAGMNPALRCLRLLAGQASTLIRERDRHHRDETDDSAGAGAGRGRSRGARRAAERPRPHRGCSSARTGSSPRRGERGGRGTRQSRGAELARRAGAGPRAARRRRRSLYSRSTSAWEQAVISGLATSTRSTAGDPLRTFRRNASRSSRLARLRRTAPPSFRLTASPRRS